jgi:hypothetical protein
MIKQQMIAIGVAVAFPLLSLAATAALASVVVYAGATSIAHRLHADH